MSQPVLVLTEPPPRTSDLSALDSDHMPCHSVSAAAARIRRRYYSSYYACSVAALVRGH